jgi:hypothetical protein
MNEPQIKMAEEWRRSIAGHSMRNGYYTDDEIKQIQLDAYKAGMTEASDIVFAHGQKFKSPHQEHFHDAAQAILSARDRKVSL